MTPCVLIWPQDAILVDVSGAATTKFQMGTGRGGSDSSIDANNVFAIQPRVYVEGSDPEGATLGTPPCQHPEMT
jgi:hypothetical protein